MLKPLPTQYKGYNFRSRLEARWACFFNYMGLYWAYESDGFDLGLRWYLPDFKIASKDIRGLLQELYIEIKPDRHLLHDKQKEQEQSLSCLFGKMVRRPLLVIHGSPYPFDYGGFVCMGVDKINSTPFETKHRHLSARFLECPRCHGLMLLLDNGKSTMSLEQLQQNRWLEGLSCDCPAMATPEGFQKLLNNALEASEKIMFAYNASRSERFGVHETGA